MTSQQDLTTFREPLKSIVSVPDRIISVYALEQHIWADNSTEVAVKARSPELQTIREFQIDPVRPFLNDIFRQMAMPWNKNQRGDWHVGQGYWVQADFGSGKSHLLCFLASLALGSQDAWDLVKEKEEKAGRGKRESLYKFWEDGLKGKSENKGIFVVSKTLVGVGGGTIGITDKTKRLTEYILDAVKSQIIKELGKNISLYPSELLADRFINHDLDLYYTPLKKFLKDPDYFSEDEFTDVDEFITLIQENRSPEFKKSCGNKLWRFYEEYLKVTPNIEAETEDILRFMIEQVLEEGYTGVLILLDEVSLFMKDRSNMWSDDEKTLVVLSNRLGVVQNLPVWIVCAAQQKIESTYAGSKNIIADDRLKLVTLLENPTDYYNIVLSRVREIKKPEAIPAYYNHYKKGFSWISQIGEDEFKKFFPFNKLSIDVLRAITSQLTTARSAIHFMHQTLKHSLDKNEIIRSYDFFDDAMTYEEDPSGTNAGISSIKTKRETEYKIYLSCRRQIDTVSKGHLKVHRERAIKILQTLFLYYIGNLKLSGLTPEDIASEILLEKSDDALPDENVQHYESLTYKLKEEIPQIFESLREDQTPQFRFSPERIILDSKKEFEEIRNGLIGNDLEIQESWGYLIGMDHWPVKTRLTNLEMSHGMKSFLSDLRQIPGLGTGDKKGDIQKYPIYWQNRLIEGLVSVRDMQSVISGTRSLPRIDSDGDETDFAVFICEQSVSSEDIEKILKRHNEPRFIIWSPGSLTQEEMDQILDFTAYRKMIYAWQGLESDESYTHLTWVHEQLKTRIGKYLNMLRARYARGLMSSLSSQEITFEVKGELPSILTPVISQVLSTVYESRDISFQGPVQFGKSEALALMNGIVKRGHLKSGHVKKEESAADNFSVGLMIARTGSPRTLNITDNPYTEAITSFISERLQDRNQIMPIATIYKNFTSVKGWEDRNFGLQKWIIQIYLLALAKEGRIRIHLGKKANTIINSIDYSTISNIEFKQAVVDAIESIEKLEKPERWDVLRQYAEKIVNKTLPDGHDDRELVEARTELLTFFKEESAEAIKLREECVDFFDLVKQNNPYEEDLTPLVNLFTEGIQEENDIDSILFALSRHLNYQAFSSETSDPQEIEDLAVRMNNYRNLKRFIENKSVLIRIYNYISYSFPERKELELIHEQVSVLKKKFSDLKPFIESNIRLKTSLIGDSKNSDTNDITFHTLLNTYIPLYEAMHNRTYSSIDQSKDTLLKIQKSPEMVLLQSLNSVSAYTSSPSAPVEKKITQITNALPSCSDASHISLERSLKEKPEHGTCGLNFDIAEEIISDAENQTQLIIETLHDAVDQAVMVLKTPAILDRLGQGKNNPTTDAIINSQNASDLKKALVDLISTGEDISSAINTSLKKISSVTVSISDFVPSSKTIEESQVEQVSLEFKNFLKKQFDQAGKEKDGIILLHLE